MSWRLQNLVPLAAQRFGEGGWLPVVFLSAWTVALSAFVTVETGQILGGHPALHGGVPSVRSLMQEMKGKDWILTRM